MKNNKNILLLAIFVILLISISSFAIYFKLQNNNYKNNTIKNEMPTTDKDSELEKINIYYLDTSSNTIVPEERNIKLNKGNSKNFDLNANIFSIFDAMKMQPKLTNHQSVVPQNLKIVSSEIKKDNLLKIEFSKEYLELKPSEEIFFRSAFVWTITELGYIKDILIYCDEKPILKGDKQPVGILNRNNVVLNPVISPEKIELEQVTLYFADEEEIKLVPEIRNIEAKQSKTLETQIVEQLILGPKEKGHFPTIPPETKIRNIKTEGGICYVDLSNDFISKQQGGSTSEIFTIYSIVNSLTELDDVNKVQFLIEGEKVNDYKGSLDISKPISKKQY